MTTMDGVFAALAALDLLALGALVWMGLAMAATWRRVRAGAGPALGHAAGLARAGAQVAEHARSSGETMVARVRGVTTAVRRRVATTRKVAVSLKPSVSETAGAVRSSAADIAGKAVAAGTFLRRAGRLKAAAEAASIAAREERAGRAESETAQSVPFTPRPS